MARADHRVCAREVTDATMSQTHACATPVSYYAGIDAATLGGASLKSTLHNLIDAHTVVSYSGAWDALAVLDASPSDSTKVVGIYSTHTHDGVSDRGISTGWNREHSWPKSYGIDYSGPDYSDLHALFAADWNRAARAAPELHSRLACVTLLSRTVTCKRFRTEAPLTVRVHCDSTCEADCSPRVCAGTHKAKPRAQSAERSPACL